MHHIFARRGAAKPPWSYAFLAALAFVATACLPGLPPPPKPPAPSNPCAAATEAAPMPPGAPAASLTVAQAVAGATAATASAAPGDVTLVTAERDDDGGLSIETHETTKVNAPAVAAEAASDGDLVAVDVPHLVTAQAVGTDPLRPQQWPLDEVGFEPTWNQYTGAGVKVAVVDSGVQANHPDLVGRVLPGAQFLNNTGVTACNGQTDTHGHGTHVAGIIAANANNAVGIAGAAPGVSILPVRVLNGAGSGWDADVSRGIIWAADRGAKVINLSLGGPASPVMQAAVTDAVARGVTVVAAGGNTAQTGGAWSYPGALPNVVAVAAIDSTNATASFSTRASYIDVAAPGVNVLSTYKGAYASLSGTSMATPYVSAGAALIVQQFPSWTPGYVQACLESTARHLGTPGKNPATGAGLIDPIAASTCT